MSKEYQVEIFQEEQPIAITSDDGSVMDFYQVACVEYDGSFYVLLEAADEEADDGMYVCQVLNYESEEDWKVEPVTDEAFANEIYDLFLAEYSKQCDGDCTACGAGCPKETKED